MADINNSTQEDTIYPLGDGPGGYYGQTFVAGGNQVSEVQFTWTQWSGGTTDYKVIIVTWVNGRPGEIIGSSDLLTVNSPQAVTVNFTGVSVTEGQTYAFLIDTTYGILNDGSGHLATNNDYGAGFFFYNHNETNGAHDFSSVTLYGDIDFAFQVKFGATAVPGAVSVTDAQLVEGNDGTSQMVFTLTRSGGTAAFSVNAATSNGSATAGSDYVASSQTVSFAANQNTATFSVTVIGDRVNEANETFQVNLSGATNGATIGTSTATGTILNDDATFTISSVSVSEGDAPAGQAVVAVSRDPAFSQFATTLYSQAVAGSATAGVDYSGGTQAVSFAAGQSVAYVSLNLLGEDVIEPSETLTINLYSDAGRTNLLSSGTVTITNDDSSSVTNAFGAGNDVLYATAPGAETLAGNAGDDQYLVNSLDDVIVEANGAGYDTVFTASSYTLNGGSFVESLSTQTHSATTNINLIGNFHDQLIIGNFGNNVLNGNGGADTLIGLQGDDTYVVGDASARIREAAGEGFDVAYARVSYTLEAGASVEVLSTTTHGDTAAINLTGNEVSQQVIGNMGANVLNGGGGNDTLIGLGGADTFAFTTALGATNVETIQDFEAGVDKLALSSSVFGNLAGSASVWFTTGTAATTADQRIVYDQATGKLFFDADGSGAGAAVLFAQLTPGTALTPADTVIIP